MQTEFEEIKTLLEQTIGLNPKVISDKAWARYVNERMLICDIKSVEDYIQRLRHSRIELQELVELLVVPETWFFRDKAAIEYIADYASNEWLPTHKEGKLSILCLPCSSGEEPYSVAMALSDISFPMARLQIDGVDVSKKSLVKAESGEYGKNSFRSKDLAYRDRYFTKAKTGNDFVLSPAIRKLIRFSYGNLIEKDLTFKFGRYDVIFCRNLFIYFENKAQTLGFEILKQLLKPGGILIVSLAEEELAKREGFSLCAPAKVGALKLAPLKSPPISLKTTEVPVKRKAVYSPPAQTISKEQKLVPSLEKARQLADKGEIAAAFNLCRDYLQVCSTDPSAYFLMGLIAHAGGDEIKAEENFLKTVYLDADFYEALIYLSLLAERKGDHAQAELYRSRAERSQKKAQKPKRWGKGNSQHIQDRECF